MKKNIKKIFIIFLLLILYIYISAFSYAKNVSSDLQKNIFRLHIIANSDSQDDQNLKYIVRDNLIKYMNTLCSSLKTKDEVTIIAKNHLQDFKKIAEKTIKDSGYSYPVNVEIGNFEFPTKNYGDISIPSGYYDALRIKIGKHEGHNWWCVMFPPLCFIDPTTGIVSEESKENLKENLSNEDYSLISDTSSPSITVKFKIIEFFKSTGLITAKNE